ncbi:hypothetical protein NA56DRAFT_415282 [Hyaloscypha hepaticicola]|uniref:Efficient mitochondria targeting-associated protein 19 n=1 Tax=Hyaloscypha hepaticicola TaxID=2082293 RepID=A0A2J6PI96_9HELO|nr:hypothetical protein NA56DRAFT_415282 [Hyaloscypha hepaticicola]
MATSILSRKRDLTYFTYFCIAVPMAFIVDLQPLYPHSMIPAWMQSITDYYIDTYNDLFFIGTPPPFFEFFMYTEMFVQVPVMIWGISALLRDSKMVPLVLLPFACLVFISTATCMYEMVHWDVPLKQRLTLIMLYGPYTALPAFIGTDMFLRLTAMINSSSTPALETSGKKNQ